ncbi:methyltransferase [Streptomyces sp. TUS-ST3]|uniref:methyltransferase n=1 Tax=Streptomyces sp. TUS-ST3 TaxID=3025591 RepID=UPI00235B3D08|nr:methyltransferase [Streptomyces sp. TUS-ST3]GLP63750.1 methyltransferase [Streptomyces sp. TUS-ST3]
MQYEEPDQPTDRPVPSGFWAWVSRNAELPAFDRLLFLLYGVRIIAILNVVAELGVADLIRERPRTAEELAEATGTRPDVLSRILRAASSIELFAELPDGRYVMTPEAESLASDGFSLRDLTLFNTGEIFTTGYAALMHSVRTGEPAFDKAFGLPLYAYFDEHPEAGELFDRCMLQRSRLVVNAGDLLSTTDFSRFSRIADIGGGRGHFLGEVLSKQPHATGVLFERQAVLDHAGPLLEQFGVQDRVDLVAGDYFAQAPAGCDAYVLNTVLNTMDDARAETVLRRVRAAMGDRADSRLFVCEKVVSHLPNKWDYSKLIDLDLLMLYGGGERTLAQWRELAARADFEVVTVPARDSSPWTALECRPV